MRRFFHVTPRANLESILTTGIEPRRAAGRVLCAVWMVSPCLLAWAVGHTQKRHGADLEDVVIIEARVPRAWLTKHQRGFWRTGRAIPPARFVRVIEASSLFDSPLFGA